MPEFHCNAYFDGYFYGYMCRRKPNHTGRHMWWIKSARNAIYWFDGRNSWEKMMKGAKSL